MALPLTGTITSAMILAEMGYTGSHTITNIVLRVNGVLQVLIDNVWVNLNMCSPYLPTEISPYIVPTHWYGYDHGISGVETITVTGDTTLDVGQVVTYTASLVGDNLTGVILTWYKFENNSWSSALNTGTSTTITWVDPRGAKVKVVASNICNRNIVEKIVDVSYNCTAVVPLAPWVVGTFYVGQTYDLYAEKALSGGGTVVLTPANLPLGATLLWEVTGNVSIIGSNTGYKCTIKPNVAGTTLNVRVSVISCDTTNTSGYSNFTGTTYSTPLYGNTQQTKSIQRNNCGGGVGGYYTVTRAADMHFSTIDVADANTMAIAWLNSQDAQDIANNNATCGDIPQVGNDYKSQDFTKYCTSGTGTIVTYAIPENTYYASNKTDANNLALADIASNGQANANSKGSCISGGCTTLVNSCSISAAGSTGTAITTNVSFSLSAAGSYTLVIGWEGYEELYREVITVYGSTTLSPTIVVPFFNTHTARLVFAVLSSCDVKISYSSTITATATGGACLNGVWATAAPLRYFSTGTVTVGVNLGNALVSGVNVDIMFLGHTYSFTDVSFAAGIQYLTFGAIASGTGAITANITGGNLCSGFTGVGNGTPITVTLAS